MPYIRALTSVVGDNFDWQSGEVYEVDEQTAQVWGDGTRAVRVSNDEAAVLLRTRDPEMAVQAPSEAAVRRGPGRPPKPRP